MAHLLRVPIEIFNFILNCLPRTDILAVLKTCKHCQILAEPQLYREFTYETHHVKLSNQAAVRHFEESNAARLFFRTLVCRPELGAHVRHLHYAGTSPLQDFDQDVKVHKLFNDTATSEDTFEEQRGHLRFRDDTARHEIEQLFNWRELGFLSQRLDELNISPSLKTNATSTIAMQFPAMVVTQGLTLAMIDFLLLFLTHVRKVKLNVQVGRERRAPFKLYSVEYASSIELLDDVMKPVWLSRFSHLTHLDFQVFDPPKEYQSGTCPTISAQDITTSLCLPKMQYLTVTNPSLDRCQWPDTRAARREQVRDLVILSAIPQVENVTYWLNGLPNLTSLSCQLNLAGNVVPPPWNDCHQFATALKPARHTLRYLELTYKQDNDEGVAAEWTGLLHEAQACDLGHILKEFRKLEELTICFSVLLCTTFYGPYRKLGGVLPSSIRVLNFHDDEFMFYEDDWDNIEGLEENLEALTRLIADDWRGALPALEEIRFCAAWRAEDLAMAEKVFDDPIQVAKDVGLIFLVQPIQVGRNDSW